MNKVVSILVLLNCSLYAMEGEKHNTVVEEVKIKIPVLKYTGFSTDTAHCLGGG